MHNGYVKLYRKLFEKGWAKKPEFVSLWVYCLIRANHKPTEVFLNGSSVLLNAGQFVASRLQISMNTGVNESKVERVLKCFQSEQQIEQQTFSKYRIISIVNWHDYQQSEQVIERKVNSKRTASEQQVNTDKNDKNEKKNKNIPASENAVDFFLTKKRRKLTGRRLETFNLFWDAFNLKKGKAEAADSWIDIPELTVKLVERIITAAKQEAQNRPALELAGKTPKWAQGWITARRWEDEISQKIEVDPLQTTKPELKAAYREALAND